MTMGTQNDPSPPSDDLRRLKLEADQLKNELAAAVQQNLALRGQLDVFEREDQIRNDANSSNAEALQLAELIIENSPAILFRRLAASDPKDRKMVYVSPNIARFGYRAEDFLSGRVMFRDILYSEDFDRTLQEIQSYVSRNIETYTQVYRIVTREGEVRWIEDRTSVVEDPTTGTRYHQGIVIDIHRRKEAEEKLRRSEEKYRRIVETAGEGFLLMDKDLKIVDLNSAYAKMVGDTPKALIGQRPFKAGDEAYRQIRYAHDEAASPAAYREFEGEIISCDGRTVPVLFHANVLRSDAGENIGTMAFVTDMTEQKKALFLAREVQRSLLPGEAPHVKGLDIAGRNMPCDEIGGDYFDFLWDVDALASPFSVVVGDITGHGVDSALLMSSARAFLRMRASQSGTISDIVTDMNHHLTEDVYATGRFMTLFYLSIDGERKGAEWVRAGHDPALIYDPDQDCFEELKGPGIALGVDQGYVYRSKRKTGLRAGQVIVVGTDGIWEARNRNGEMFGKQRFNEIIRRNAAASAESILKKVFQEQAHFSRGMKREDDITLVVVKIVR
jgi:phosphoserine phosphatase RsbU/P